jgi:hypothetical protein
MILQILAQPVADVQKKPHKKKREGHNQDEKKAKKTKHSEVRVRMGWSRVIEPIEHAGAARWLSVIKATKHTSVSSLLGLLASAGLHTGQPTCFWAADVLGKWECLLN